MRKIAFWKDLKKDAFNIFVSFVILSILTFLLLFLINITSNIILNVILYLLLLSDIIAICTLIGVFIYFIFEYNYQKKHYAIIQKHLSDKYYAIIQKHLSDKYSVIFPNRDNLSSLSILQQPDIICKAKLNSDGHVVLRIENISSSNTCYETTTSNFDLFCRIFNFYK